MYKNEKNTKNVRMQTIKNDLNEKLTNIHIYWNVDSSKYVTMRKILKIYT